MLGETEGLYSTPITFQEVIAGHLRISLDNEKFQQPMTISLQSMGILSLILLALTLSLSMRLGRHISTPLLQMRLWLRDPDDPAPGAGRNDEIGDLARQLQARLVPEKPEPEQELDDEQLLDDSEDYLHEEDDERFNEQEKIPAEHAAFDEADISDEYGDDEPLKPWPDTIEPDDPFADLRDESEAPAPVAKAPRPSQASAVLAIQLGAQEQLRRLPRTRLLDLLDRYRGCLEQAAALYQGQLHTLKDGSSLMLFHERECGEDYLTHAICCGELMRALGHALQIEVADSGITLQLQLGLTLGSDLEELGQADLLLSDSALDALALSQHSRNLLLVEQRVAQDALARQRARIRPIASPEGASCVERLLDPYPALLERQLTRMRDSRV